MAELILHGKPIPHGWSVRAWVDAQIEKNQITCYRCSCSIDGLELEYGVLNKFNQMGQDHTFFVLCPECHERVKAFIEDGA